MRKRTEPEYADHLSRHPLVRSIHADTEWSKCLARPERGVLSTWLAWGIPVYDGAVAALETSLAILRDTSAGLLHHYLAEMASRRTWGDFWGIRTEVYLAAWLAGRGFGVRLAEPSDRGKADLVASAKGGDVTIEVSACFRPEEEQYMQRIWDLEVRIRGLGIPAPIDLHETWVESGSDTKQIVEALRRASRDLGGNVGEHSLDVRRGPQGWCVQPRRLSRPEFFGGIGISWPPLHSHLTPARLVEKLRAERKQLPKDGVSIICLDMTHVDDWYATQLMNHASLPCDHPLSEMVPAVETFLDGVDGDHRVAAVLLFVRSLHRTALDRRFALWRQEVAAHPTLAPLLREWMSLDGEVAGRPIETSTQ